MIEGRLAGHVAAVNGILHLLGVAREGVDNRCRPGSVRGPTPVPSRLPAGAKTLA